METRRFRDLNIWQRSMQLARRVYSVTERFPKSEIFGLTNQMRRAAVSVPSNIAGGRGRLTDKSFAAFLGQARGSLFELQTQIQLARDLGIANSEQTESLLSEASEISSMIHALLSSIRRDA